MKIPYYLDFLNCCLLLEFFRLIGRWILFNDRLILRTVSDQASNTRVGIVVVLASQPLPQLQGRSQPLAPRPALWSHQDLTQAIIDKHKLREQNAGLETYLLSVFNKVRSAISCGLRLLRLGVSWLCLWKSYGSCAKNANAIGLPLQLSRGFPLQLLALWLLLRRPRPVAPI